MKKRKKTEQSFKMLKEYDFSSGVRGKYAKKYAQGTNIVLLEPDVDKTFPNSQTVNEVLRSLARIIHQQTKRASV